MLQFEIFSGHVRRLVGSNASLSQISGLNFKGNFNEANELKTSLEDFNPRTFEDCLKWIGTEQFVLEIQNVDGLEADSEIRLISDEDKAFINTHLDPIEARKAVDVKEVLRRQISQCLEFLIAADFLMITPDPTETIISDMMVLLKDDDTCTMKRRPFTHEIMVNIFELLPTHPARDLIAKACVHDYLGSRMEASELPFPYEEELSSIPGFAKQLCKSTLLNQLLPSD